MKKYIIGLCLVGMMSSASIAWGHAGRSSRADQSRSAPSRAIEHPLTPLTPAEIRKTHEIVAAHFTNPASPLPKDKLRIPILALKEPAKAALLGERGSALPREASVEIFHYPSNRLWAATVDLKTAALKSLALKNTGTQPAITADEFVAADELVHAFEPWKLAMAQRGVDPAKVYVDVWAPGDVQLPAAIEASLPFGKQTRLLQALAFWRNGDADSMDDDMPQNPYDRAIEGVVVTLDMNTLKVVHMTNTLVRPVSNESGNALIRRTDLNPLKVSQPSGASFDVKGRQVHWQKWNFFIYLHPREGLVLSDVRYGDPGESRRIAHRMSLSEIYVPYGVGDKNWTWRSAFDVGEYNLATYAQTLEVNADVPENTYFFDAVFASDTGPSAGNPNGTVAYPATIGLYERDGGVLWTRTDPSTYARDTRYARELVATWSAWIGNYIYAFDWIFKMDGTIEIKTHLTGTTLNRGAPDGLEETGAPVVSVSPNGARVAAPNHQHFFNFRLDLDVDGVQNRVVEENVVHIDQPGFDNVFDAIGTLFTAEGFHDFNVSTNRSWAVESATTLNALGKPTAYGIESTGYTPPLSTADYAPLQRALFATHQMWVTRYQEGERYASGDHPNQGPVGEGLPKFISPAEPLDAVAGDDVVVWYSTGFTHVPRPEDYPVMPTESIGFKILPSGFFSSNPALDAPKQ